VNSPFSITLFATLPQGAADSSFIDSINVNVGGTIWSTLGGLDIKIEATKVLKNTMDFPLLVSYYQYMIKLVDQDGVTGSCGPFSNDPQRLVPGFNPCWIPFLGLCYDPWSTPTAIGPLITSGDYNNVRPGNTILFNNQKYLEPKGGTGPTTLTIDSTLETSVRLVDEMMTKNMMCGDIEQGIVLVGLQADRSCNDVNRAEIDLTCTFPLRVKFSLKNFALSKLDTCGSIMDVPNYLGFNFYVDALPQFNDPWPVSGYPPLNPVGQEVQLLGGTSQAMSRTSFIPINTEDSFEIQFDVKISCSTEGFSLTFLAESPSTYNWPRVSTSCPKPYGCYASGGLSTGYPFASLVIGFSGCNGMAWVKGGALGIPYRGSQSCVGDYVNNGNWGRVTFTYNAHDKRATAAYEQGGNPRRAFDFDLDLKDQLGGLQYAFPTMVANSGSGSCSDVRYRNIVHRGPRTNGAKSTLEGGLTLVRSGEIGTVMFRARDENGRKRGKGGNSWQFEIRKASDNTLASQDMTVSPRFIDNQDGTYTLRYRVYGAGRYIVRVACDGVTGTTVCNSGGQFATLTSGLFIRS
jgi:hypothetical protein